MRSTFAGMEIARRSLQAQRQALDVTGHNIANANTPGYSRQVARLATTEPFAHPTMNRPAIAGQMGTGVHVQQVVRMTDAFVQRQLNSETHSDGYWQTRGQILHQIELAFLEPTGSGVRSALDQFWDAWQELSKNPESQAVRSVVREQALVLTDTIRSTYDQLEPLRQQLDFEIRTKVSELNALGSQIAAINKEIAAVLATGGSPNDLLDRRDLLIHQMSRITDIQVVERNQGMVAVAIGGMNLVDGLEHRTLAAVDPNREGISSLVWADTGEALRVKSGELHALLEGRDVEVPHYVEQLNELARQLIHEVNALHRQGYGLYDSFDPNDYEPHNPAGGPPPAPPARNFFKDAADDPAVLTHPAAALSLVDEILADAGNIAASKSGAVGDGQIALGLAQLRDQRIFSNGSATPGEFLASVVSGLGVQSEKAASMVEHQALLLGHLERLQASVSGVSLDEEMTNMIMFQHAYAAASRVVTTMDETIDMIINRMGLVGRA